MIFVSHAHSEHHLFDSFRRECADRGIDVWTPQELKPGSSLAGQIRNAVVACDACVFIATAASVKSDWCLAEVGAFWGVGKPVIPYLHSGAGSAELPDIFGGDFVSSDPFEVMRTAGQFVELERKKVRFAQLGSACCRIWARGTMSTGFLVAEEWVAASVYWDDSPGDREPTVCFPGGEELPVVEARTAPESRTAFLRLAEKVSPAIPPLRTGVEVGGSCEGIGFSPRAEGYPIPFRAVVVDRRRDIYASKDDFIVQSETLKDYVVEGFGGAPLWAGDGVVGHIDGFFSEYEDVGAGEKPVKRLANAQDIDDGARAPKPTGKTAFGLFFVTGSARIRRSMADLIGVSPPEPT